MEVAEAIGVDNSYIARAEAGKPVPQWLAGEIARVLGCEVSEVFKPYISDTRLVCK